MLCAHDVEKDNTPKTVIPPPSTPSTPPPHKTPVILEEILQLEVEQAAFAHVSLGIVSNHDTFIYKF